MCGFGPTTDAPCSRTGRDRLVPDGEVHRVGDEAGRAPRWCSASTRSAIAGSVTVTTGRSTTSVNRPLLPGSSRMAPLAAST